MLVSKFKSFNNFLKFTVGQAYGIHTGAHFRNAGYIVD